MQERERGDGKKTTEKRRKKDNGREEGKKIGQREKINTTELKISNHSITHGNVDSLRATTKFTKVFHLVTINIKIK